MLINWLVCPPKRNLNSIFPKLSSLSHGGRDMWEILQLKCTYIFFDKWLLRIGYPHGMDEHQPAWCPLQIQTNSCQKNSRPHLSDKKALFCQFLLSKREQNLQHFLTFDIVNIAWSQQNPKLKPSRHFSIFFSHSGNSLLLLSHLPLPLLSPFESGVERD